MPILGAFMVPHPPLAIPEIGRGSEKQIANTIESYERVAKRIAEIKPDTIIISSPHTYLYYDHYYLLPGKTVTGDMRNFGHSEVSFEENIDEEVNNEITKLADDIGLKVYSSDEKPELDHGTMVPLYFIEKYYKDFNINVIGLSEGTLQEHYKIGQIIKEAVENLERRVVYIASGDLSHKLKEDGPYGFVEEGPIYDDMIIDIMSHAQFDMLLSMNEGLCKKAAVCGHKSFTMMAGFLDTLELDTTFYSYEGVTGVGYGICSYIPIEYSEDRKFLDKYIENEKAKIINQRSNCDSYVEIAVNAILKYINEGKVLDLSDDIPLKLLEEKKAVFVTLYKFNRLRGCIGSIVPSQENVAKEIIGKAISAATNDFRFKPVTKEELDYLEVHVDVLTPLEEVHSKEDLDIKKYGIVVSSGIRRGVLLPDIDSIESVDHQIAIALKKGDIDPKEDYTIQRFQVVRHI